MTATHKSRRIPVNFHRLWMLPPPKGGQELPSQGHINHFRRVYLCWEEGEREQCSCTEESLLTTGWWHPQLRCPLTSYHKLLWQPLLSGSTGLLTTPRYASLHLQEPSHHNPPVLQTRERSQNKYKPSAWFWCKVQLTWGGTGITAWEGELFVRRIRLVIARILNPSSWNKGEL